MCDCDICQLSRRISAEKPNMTPETLSIVRHLWNLWEAAETDLCMSQRPKPELPPPYEISKGDMVLA